MADTGSKKQLGKSNPASQPLPIPIESLPPKDQPSLIDAVVEANKRVRAISQQPPQRDIPRFDLAEDIMAEQRKTIAQKRKSPLDEPEYEFMQPKAPPADKPAVKPQVKKTDTEQIIRDIVARDIKYLCDSSD